MLCLRKICFLYAKMSIQLLAPQTLGKKGCLLIKIFTL